MVGSGCCGHTSCHLGPGCLLESLWMGSGQVVEGHQVDCIQVVRGFGMGLKLVKHWTSGSLLGCASGRYQVIWWVLT